MSQLSGHSNRDSNNPTPSSSPPNDFASPLRARGNSIHRNSAPIRPASPVHPSSPIDTPVTNSPVGRNRSNSGRPLSIVQTFQPPIMDVGEDTIPELQPIFTFLNSHSNKLYQEGYFLKLDDQNTRTCHLGGGGSLRQETRVANREPWQMVDPTRTAHGQNVLRNSWAPCCPCGTPPSWTLQARMARCCPNLSI